MVNLSALGAGPKKLRRLVFIPIPSPKYALGKYLITGAFYGHIIKKNVEQEIE
jgi:hypothetical protein